MVTELVNAVKAGEISAMKRMLAAGANVNSRDTDGSTLLMLAASEGDLPMVKVLIEGGADVNACDERGWAALAKAVYNTEMKRGFAEVVKALIAAGANIEAAIGYGVRRFATCFDKSRAVPTLMKSEPCALPPRGVSNVERRSVVTRVSPDSKIVAVMDRCRNVTF